MTPAATGAGDLPPGYRESASRGTRLVAHERHHDAIRAAVASGTLYGWAAARPGAKALHGRGVAWATQLDDGTAVVVRHSRHGGALASVTRDLFLTPSRAPHELLTAIRLRASGVPTPEVLAYATYAALGPLCRADVVTRLVAGTDLPAAWTATPAGPARAAIVGALGTLLAGLQSAGVVHPDLNVKNILIGDDGAGTRAWVLDVDRVEFVAPGAPAALDRNAARLGGSLAKWRRLHGLDFADAEWEQVVAAAGRRYSGASPGTT